MIDENLQEMIMDKIEEVREVENMPYFSHFTTKNFAILNNLAMKEYIRYKYRYENDEKTKRLHEGVAIASQELKKITEHLEKIKKMLDDLRL